MNKGSFSEYIVRELEKRTNLHGNTETIKYSNNNNNNNRHVSNAINKYNIKCNEINLNFTFNIE